MISVFSPFFESSSSSTSSIPENSSLEDAEFRLPVDYLPSSDIHRLSDTVATDLELAGVDPSSNTMYTYLLNPKTPFEENMIPLWSRSYTTNIEFLKE